MSVVEIHGLDEDVVTFSDGQGRAELPVDQVEPLWRIANQRDAAWASFEGRRFDRDTLLALRSWLDSLDQCENRHPGWECDRRATQTLWNGKKVCDECSGDASAMGAEEPFEVAL